MFKDNLFIKRQRPQVWTQNHDISTVGFLFSHRKIMEQTCIIIFTLLILLLKSSLLLLLLLLFVIVKIEWWKMQKAEIPFSIKGNFFSYVPWNAHLKGQTKCINRRISEVRKRRKKGKKKPQFNTTEFSYKRLHSQKPFFSKTMPRRHRLKIRYNLKTRI